MILVLEHDSRFTKGVILNRPTSYTRKGLNKEDEEWRVWYGGDVRGLNDKEKLERKKQRDLDFRTKFYAEYNVREKQKWEDAKRGVKTPNYNDQREYS